MLHKFKQFLKNLLTVDNGEDFSFIRITFGISILMTVFMITIGVPLWSVICAAFKIPFIPISEWGAYYAGSAVLLGGVLGSGTVYLNINHKNENVAVEPPGE